MREERVIKKRESRERERERERESNYEAIEERVRMSKN